MTASIWFGMFVAALLGWDEPPGWLSDGPATLVVYATLAYGLGVIVDSTADTLFMWMMNSRAGLPVMWALSPKDNEGRIKALPNEVFGRLRDEALQRDDGLAKLMEYQRSRQRIARATTLNLLLLLPIGWWFLQFTVGVGGLTITAFLIAVPIAIWVSGRSAERLRVAYESRLEGLPLLGTPVSASWIRAAAVCVRTEITGMELLVVRTKEPATASERWTFPKGHVEPGESPLEAAMREADEEAGARGFVHRDPLPLYLFPAGASADALVVVPFLMEMAEQPGVPTEPGRTMRWASPEDAKELLRRNREKQFEHEHDRVIDRAIQVMGER